MKTIKILLVDDHKLIREGIKHILGLQGKFIPDIDEADNGNEAIQKTAIINYDIIIMDIQMPEKDGIEATKFIMKKKKSTKVLALSMYSETHYIQAMLEAGAMGYVLKTTGPEELSNAIITLLNGKKFFSNEVAIKLLDFPQIIPNKKRQRKNKLSSREAEIIKMIARELTNDEIATRLFISKRTVENHRSRIMKKLEANSMAGIIKYAVLNNLIN